MLAASRWKRDKPFGLESFFHVLVLLGNLLVVVALSLSAFSNLVSPLKGWFFPYLGLLFPVFFLGNIFFLVYWLIRLRIYVVFSLLGIILSWHQFRVYFPMHSQTEEVPVNSIKILSYNVRCFNYQRHTRKKPNPVVEYILRQDADIVCLQEFGWSKNEGFLDRKEILKAFRKYPYYKITGHVDNEWSFAGLVCFSKYPIVASHKLKMESLYNGSTAYTIRIGNRKIDLINNHLESNKFTSDDIGVYKKVIKDFSSKNLEDFNDVVIKKMGQAYKERAKQAMIVRDYINESNREIIVCGDFNDSAISYVYQTIKGDMEDAYVDTGFGPGITYNENRFYFRIDHILHSKGIEAYNCKVDRIKLSDHFPISCYVTFKEDARQD